MVAVFISEYSSAASAHGSLFSLGQTACHLNLGDSKVAARFGSVRLVLVDSVLALGALCLNAHKEDFTHYLFLHFRSVTKLQ